MPRPAMRRIVTTALLLACAPPALAQPVLSSQPVLRRAQPATQSADASLSNPSTMDLRIQLNEITGKIDDLASDLAAQKSALAAIDGKLAALNAALAQFRQVSDQQYSRLRTTGYVDCIHSKTTGEFAEPMDLAEKHCVGWNMAVPDLPGQ